MGGEGRTYMLDVILSACLLLAPSGCQDSARLVDDMIARSNALKSFVATYNFYYRSKDTERKESEGSVRLVYRAPEELFTELKTEDLRMNSAIANGRVSVLVEKEGRPFQHGEADLETILVQERARIAHAFREKFPSLGEVDESFSLGAFVRFTWEPATKSKGPEFNFQAGTGRGDAPLLDWLSRLKRSSAKLGVEGDDVVWEPAEGFRILIRKDSGFIEKIVATYAGETKTVLELADLSLDTEVKDAEFRFAEIDPSVADTSESLSKSLGMTELTSMRSSIHRKIREAIEAGTLDWTSDTRVGLGAVLRAFHSEFAPFYWGDSMRSIRSAVDKHCLWYQETKQGISKDEVARAEASLEEKRISWETSFRESTEKVIEPYLARQVPDVGGKNASKFSGEIRALELEAAEAACRKSVVEPLLEYLAQQMELAGRGELPPAKH